MSVTKFDSSFLISIDGIPRTVINSFRGRFDNGTWTNLPLSDYRFAWSNSEYVGGPVYFKLGNDGILLEGGNPPLYLPQSIIDQYKSIIKTIQLPDKQYFQDVAKSYEPRGMQFYIGAGIMSTVSLTDPKCQTTTSSLNLIGIFPNNDQWYYDARIILDQNTLDKPIPDGGGMSGTLCSNVAKNFLNRKYIHLIHYWYHHEKLINLLLPLCNVKRKLTNVLCLLHRQLACHSKHPIFPFYLVIVVSNFFFKAQVDTFTLYSNLGPKPLL